MNIGDELVITDRIYLNIRKGLRGVVTRVCENGWPECFIAATNDHIILLPGEYRLISPLELLAEVAE